MLWQIDRPGQYLGNEWGSRHKSFCQAIVRLCLAFPDIYELGMSNFGQRILYQLVNEKPDFMADRTYAPMSDMEALLRQKQMPLWGWESRERLDSFDLLGFSLQYELTYTNLLNMLDLANIPILAAQRTNTFPLVFGGGPSAVNPEPLAAFLDFFIIGDGEEAIIRVMETVQQLKAKRNDASRTEILKELAISVPGVYVPSLYKPAATIETDPYGRQPYIPISDEIPARVLRQVEPLVDTNQPTQGIVPYMSPVHDRQVMEVRRGCDRGCRFCQPGYTFLPVRERSADDLVRLSKEAIKNTGYEEYTMLSLCVSDYTSLHESVRSLNREHASQRTSMSFPSQRADRMSLDIAEELKAVRKSGITLAPEAGTERLRAVINKGLNHEQIITAIVSAFQSGWYSVKLYFMIGLPTEKDEDLTGIIDILKEATGRCRALRRSAEPGQYKQNIEFTCTISNFVPKPFTPFQWFPQVEPAEFARKQTFLRQALKESGLKNVTLNATNPQTSLLESVISRGNRATGELIYRTWRRGATFDAWEEKFKPELWHAVASDLGIVLEDITKQLGQVGSKQPWDVIHIGLADWWMVKEWNKAMSASETAPCTENTCHACGICTELDTNHLLANPSVVVLGKNPFVKELNQFKQENGDSHPSLFFMPPPAAPKVEGHCRIRFIFKKKGELKFISHLDIQHLLIRAARRAELSFAYTEGFNPAPKLSIALSLPLYSESIAEVAEAEFIEMLTAEDFISRINKYLPPEVQILEARLVEKSSFSLAEKLAKAKYRAFAVTSTPTTELKELLESSVQKILSSSSLEVAVTSSHKNKKKKNQIHKEAEPTYRNIRNLIFAISVEQSPENIPYLCFEIAHGSKSHLKPSDLLNLIQPEFAWRTERLVLAAEDGTALYHL